MNIYEKLMAIQFTLKAPKNQFNSFGKYKYRSLEDVTEAVKPLLHNVKATLTICDEPVMIGDRFYIKATSTLTNAEKPEESISNTAYAREQASKKGADDSQITGTASSYARKYCLNGLFAIDDTKDADTMDNGGQTYHPTVLKPAQVKELTDLLIAKKADEQAFLKFAGATKVADINPNKFGQLKSMLLAKKVA